MVFSIIVVSTVFLQLTQNKKLFWIFLCKKNTVFYFTLINQYTRQSKFLPVVNCSHPVYTLHMSSSQSHKPLHPCPYEGYVQLIVQFIPVYPGVHAGINFYKKIHFNQWSLLRSVNAYDMNIVVFSLMSNSFINILERPSSYRWLFVHIL